MMKTQIGIGVLSIPAAFETLGMAPGVICLLVIGAITTWSDYMVGVFKTKHPEVYNIDDVGFKLFGKVGRECFATVYLLYWIFVAGSGILGLSISFNAMSDHGTCTAVFVVVSAIIGFLLGSIQTLGRISWLAWVGVTSILAAVFTVTIAVAVEDRPSAAPPTPGPFHSDWKVTTDVSFADAMSAIASIIFAYSGTPGFFSIASEMREPRHFSRSLVICQSVISAVYLIVGVVVYYYCGSYVASPALGSAGSLLKRISYGLAFPGLTVSTTLFIHVSPDLFSSPSIGHISNPLDFSCPVNTFSSESSAALVISPPTPSSTGSHGSVARLPSPSSPTSSPPLSPSSILSSLLSARF